MRADAFYADSRRSNSEEIEFGREWLDALGYGWYQLNWIVDTGEVVAFYIGGASAERGADLGWDEMGIPGAIFGAMAGGFLDATTGGPEQVIIFGSIGDREAVDHALDGWRAQMGRPGGFAWLRDRIAAHRDA